MKTSKFLALKLAIVALLAVLSSSSYGSNVIHVENSSTGQFLSSAGAALTAGGVSVGFFSIAIPTAADWLVLATQNIATAYGRLAGSEFGFKDVRSLPGTTLATGFDWDFPLPVGGTVQNIGIADLSQNTPLYVLAFNNGTWNVNIGLSFLGATEWAAVAASNWLAPASLGSISLLLSNVDTPLEVKVGADSGPLATDVNIRTGAPVPEPSTAALLGVAVVSLFATRRRTLRA